MLKSLVTALVLIAQTITNSSSGVFQQDIQTKKPSFSGWLAWWDTEEGKTSFDSASKSLSQIMPVWYKIDENGEIVEISYPLKSYVMKQTREKGIKILPTIGNDFDAKRISEIISDEKRSANLAEELVNIAKDEGYHGWDIDFEMLEEKDKASFTQFLKITHEKLDANGLILSVDLHAKTADEGTWHGNRAQDWREIGKNADLVRIMIYDYHNAETQPGAITPTSYLEDVLSYAEKNILKRKTVVALPTYGYRWQGEEAEAITYQKAAALIGENEAKRDQESGELYYDLSEGGGTDVIWFQDSKTNMERIQIARQKGYNRFSFWRIGAENDGFWEDISEE